MGIDQHALQLLTHAYARRGAFGSTVTLGRQSVILGPDVARRWIGSTQGGWCEPLLEARFGATSVESIDNSAYEGATIVADFNRPMPAALTARFDTVLDLGCTEHIFDVAQSFRNIVALCKPGGWIIHEVPSDGCCGHGFFQFTPELFHSWYCADNGFDETQVYLADTHDVNAWYRVPAPQDGKRINIRSQGEVYVLVLTRYLGGGKVKVQQSDYEFMWADGARGAKTPPPVPGRLVAWRERLARWPWAVRWMTQLDARLAPMGARTLSRHPALTRVPLPRL